MHSPSPNKVSHVHTRTHNHRSAPYHRGGHDWRHALLPRPRFPRLEVWPQLAYYHTHAHIQSRTHLYPSHIIFTLHPHPIHTPSTPHSHNPLTQFSQVLDLTSNHLLLISAGAGNTLSPFRRRRHTLLITPSISNAHSIHTSFTQLQVLDLTSNHLLLTSVGAANTFALFRRRHLPALCELSLAGNPGADTSGHNAEAAADVGEWQSY